MGEQWKEEHLLNLVDAVRKVEDGWQSHERIWRNSKVPVVCEEGKWDQVASEIPFSVFMEVNNRSPGWYEDFAGVCKRKFCEICEHFNNVFVKSERNNCLTRTLMTNLAEYSIGFPEQPYFFKTGPEAKFIKTDRETEWLAPSASATVAESSTGFPDQQPHQTSDIRPRRECIQADRGTGSLAHLASSPTMESFGGPPEEPLVSKTGPRAKHIKTDRESTQSPTHSARTIGVDWSSTIRDWSLEVSHHSTPFNEQLDTPASSNSDQQESNEQTETETRSSWDQCPQDDLEENNFEFKPAEFVKRMTFSSVKKGFLLVSTRAHKFFYPPVE